MQRGLTTAQLRNNPSQMPLSTASPWVNASLWDYSPPLYPAAKGIKTTALNLSKQLPSTTWLWSPALTWGLRAALASPIPRAGCSPHPCVHT